VHRYMLGLYRVLDTLNKKFPNVLFEGCSGGGGRFDFGMLQYFPQIWTSDDSDAVERLYIQHGTSMLYPTSAMGAHVSAVPNHQVHRVTPIDMRGRVAMCGQFGYELDLNKLSDEEFETVKEQIKLYKKISHITHKGTMYRLLSPFEGNYTAWEFLSEDESEIVLMIANIIKRGGRVAATRVLLKGLDENANYIVENTGEVYGGDFLMNIGFIRMPEKDFESELLIIKKVK
ncbi:MAG: alpha-galactosidase, partial [Oscillospiraceae bacterium]|nr:alpha-galactosidase [Oscillospiraceae bacterium]